MFSGKTYRTLALVGAFLMVAVQSLSAMACPMHMEKAPQPMRMACCTESASQVMPVCPVNGSMTSQASCSCQVTPASEITHKAVVPAPVPVMEAAVAEVLTEQLPEAPKTISGTDDPPDLHLDVPIFLRLRTLLN